MFLEVLISKLFFELCVFKKKYSNSKCSLVIKQLANFLRKVSTPNLLFLQISLVIPETGFKKKIIFFQKKFFFFNFNFLDLEAANDFFQTVQEKIEDIKGKAMEMLSLITPPFKSIPKFAMFYRIKISMDHAPSLLLSLKDLKCFEFHFSR